MRRSLRWLCLALPLAATAGCGGGGGGGGGSSSAAATLCGELISCGQLDSMYRSACVQQLQIYVPDPVAAKACIDGMGLTCADVSDSTAVKEVAKTCFYDTTKFACDATSTTLTMCSPATPGYASVCKELDCSSACHSLFGVGGSCGYEPTDGWDKCLCGS